MCIVDSEECEKIDRALEAATARWRPQSSELKSAASMLDKASGYWGRYNDGVGDMESWLNQAEKMMTAPPAERQAFFNDYSQWADRRNLLNQQGDFLIGVSDDPTAAEVKKTLNTLNKRFEDLGNKVNFIWNQF